MKNYQKKMAGIAIMGMVALTPSCATHALSQDETVYAKLGSDGEAYETSVVEHLKNETRDYQLFDKTNLHNLENLNGFESFVVEDGRVVWNAEGKDIYYRGDAQEKLPVQLNVVYKMNGEVKTLDEIIGRAGEFEIRYKFTNLQKVGELYTPFVVALTTTLKENAVVDLEVTNGKAESNGRTLAVAGVAAPGLYESLGIAELEGTDEIVLKFKSDKFEINDVYMVVTPKLLDSEDLKIFSELNSLSESVNVLADSSKKLADGSTSLVAGLGKLRAGIVAAKQQASEFTIKIDDVTMAQIKTVAAASAEKAVEAKRAEFESSVDAQLAGETGVVLTEALHLEAEAMCKAQVGGAACPDENIVKVIEEKLLTGVKQDLAESTINAAKQAARETASATAEQVANQVTSTAQAKVAPTVASMLGTIIAGVDQVTQGAEELNVGITKFNQDGIQPIASFVNGKIKVTANKVEALLKLADEYQSYAGIADGAKGNTKFVMMIEAKRAK